MWNVSLSMSKCDALNWQPLKGFYLLIREINMITVCSEYVLIPKVSVREQKTRYI